jgi:hypothetical protein
VSLLARDGTIFAGAHAGGVFYSTDNGKSWRAKPSFRDNFEDWLAGLAINQAGDLVAARLSMKCI